MFFREITKKIDDQTSLRNLVFKPMKTEEEFITLRKPFIF